MPEVKAWAGNKLVDEQVLQGYDTDVDSRIVTAKSEAIAAAETKDQNLMTDVETKITTAVDKALSDANAELSKVETNLKAADQTLQTNIDTVSGGLTALSDVVETLPTTTDVNDAIVNALSSVYKFKGSVADFASLPTGYGQAQIGWVYNTEDTGMNYAWTGTAWDSLGGDRIVTQLLTSAEYNTILTNGSLPSGADGKIVGADAYRALRNKVPNLVPFSGLPQITSGVLAMAQYWEGNDTDGYTIATNIGTSNPPSNVMTNSVILLVVIESYVDPAVGLSIDSVSYNHTSGWTLITFKARKKPEADIDGAVYILSTSHQASAILLFTGGGGTGGGSGSPEYPQWFNYTGAAKGIPNNDFLNVKYVDPMVTNNESRVFDIPNVRTGLYFNTPPAWGSDENVSRVIGVRDVLFLDSTEENPKVMVRITEAYPWPGRIHVSFLYKAGDDLTWTPWACTKPRAATNDPVPIAEGGTGGATAADAMKNLITPLPTLDSVAGPHDFINMHIPFSDSVINSTEFMSVVDMIRWASGRSDGYTLPVAGTDYTASRARAISLHISLPTTIVNGCIYGIYS